MSDISPTQTSCPSLRFVVLEHTGTSSYKPGVHWDLLCEDGELLRAWEFAELPNIKRLQPVVLLPPHQSKYLTYEGPISGDRGIVRRVTEGTYKVIQDIPRLWHIQLEGQYLRGELQIEAQIADKSLWMASFRPT